MDDQRTNREGGASLTLRFPWILRPLFAAAALLGIVAVFAWGVPVYTRGAPAPEKWQFAMILLAPIGAGFLLMTFQKIVVTNEYIDSHYLGFRKRLDITTTRIAKVQSNGCTLQDGSGRKLFVHNFLVGNEILLRLLAEK